jgi:signal transduction histidine kinase
MPNSTPSREALTRQRIIRVFLIQGLLGLGAMVALTLTRTEQTAQIVDTLGSGAWVLTILFFVLACVLQLLKFELTDLIFVSLGISAFVAMYPLLGGVITSWTAIIATIGTRWLGMRQIGPVKIDMSDPKVEYVKTFGLFGTYGIPIVLSSLLYETLGGTFPTLNVSRETVLRLITCGLAVIVANNLVLSRMMKAYGYDVQRRVRLLLSDCSIYLLTLPYAICLTLVYGALGWGAVLALAFTGVLANLAARNLAVTRGASVQQLQRLASLSNIGKTISLQFTTAELMQNIYTECRKVVDASIFSVALLDERTDELVFELDVQDGVLRPRDRMTVGEGLNSWVVANNQPLLIGSGREERRFGISAVDDGMVTESWLGVPMVARDRVIGVIAIQSYRKNAFTHDDLLLLTAVANQAAVAIENANLYKDLEGLTHALEERVLERTRELNETNLRLRAADRSKNQFLANMSHELRTPLNSIIGFSSVLLDAARDLLPARLYKFLENIRTAGNHLLELINDILDLSKIEAGKMELRPDRFDLRETIASVERVMKGMASDSRVTIVSDIAPDVPQVCLDEGRLKQILFNLLSNAVKFSPRGGPVTVSVTKIGKADSALGVDTVRLEVRDRGIGIAEDELKRIFDEFYQTDHGRASRKGGTGLGLSLTRNFVELHFGTIDVKSTVGEGSSFILYLPVDYYEAAATRAAMAPIPPSRSFREQPPLVH